MMQVQALIDAARIIAQLRYRLARIIPDLEEVAIKSSRTESAEYDSAALVLRFSSGQWQTVELEEGDAALSLDEMCEQLTDLIQEAADEVAF